MNSTISKLVDTAWHLAAIQLEGVQDYTGFSNADKNVGAHLAAIVQADPSDMDAITALASLVGVKYQRQTLGLVGPEMAAQFKALGKGTKLTPEQRFAARNTVVAQPDKHEKFGMRVLFSFQFNQDFGYALKQNGGRAFFGPDGWKWAVPLPKVADAVAALKRHGARIVGNVNFDGVQPEAVKRERIVNARLDGKRVVLTFGYDRALVDAVKIIPSRRYDTETKEWSISARELAIAVDNLRKVGDDVNVDELLAIAPMVPQTARPVEVEEEPVTVEHIPATAHDYQRDGIAWLVEPLSKARSITVNGTTIRGKILGDKMGLGKTLQTEVASRAILDSLAPEGRVLVICPATAKINWQREIAKFCGDDQTVHIVNGDNGPDKGARWNIVNYDVLKQNYEALVNMGFDILLIDEAHYIKNREAERSRLVVGGKVSFPEKLSAKQEKTLRETHARVVAEAKKAHEAKYAEEIANGEQYPAFREPKMKWPHKAKRIEGLAAAAKLRVFPMTGTPLANRPKDLFNLLRAIGHPLGKNFRDFAMRYCDPETNRFGTVYNGSSNLQELAERISPVFLQRFKVPGLKEMVRNWTPVEVDLKAYREVMREYAEKRKLGLLSSMESHLALIGEARMCAAIAKIPATISKVEDAIEQDEKVIVFSEYTKVITKLKAHFGDAAVVLDGSKSQTQRQDAIDRFQNDPTVKVFIGNTIAAGTAITLTAATQVKFNDLNWVPANLLQAEKRAHRIGQTETVFVEYILAAGTFDEEMAVLLEEKMEQVNEFEGTSDSLFLQLVERLNQAPQNAEAKAEWLQREKRGALATAA